jgi:uncharacterized protein (TIGR03000 family)
MYRRLLKASALCTVALGLWLATPEAQAQRRGGWGGGGWGRGSPGISFGVDRGGFYAGPSVGRYGGYGWDGYGGYGYGGYGYGSRFYDRGWYGSTWPRSSYYYSSPGYSSYYPSTTYYSSPAVTYSYPSTTYYESAPATTYSESAPAAASSSRDTAHIRVHVPEPTAQLWVNDSPTQQRGTDRVFETPPLRDDRTNTYEIRAKWQDEGGRTMEQTRTVRVQPGEREVVSFGQAE